MRRFLHPRLLVVLAILALVLASYAGGTAAGTGPRSSAEPCSPQAITKPAPEPGEKQHLVIATGGTGGVFFAYGGGLARVLSAKLPGAKVTAEVTGGSVDNINLIDLGDADIALSTVDSAYDAYKGQEVYEKVGVVPVCTIAVLYRSYAHVVTLEDMGINSIADLKGKRVSVGSAGSSTEAVADRLLEAAGLNPKADVGRDNLSVAESVGALKDRKIAAFFWVGGLPTSAVTDLVNTPGIRAKFLPSGDYLKPLSDKYGAVYVPAAMPKGGNYKLEQEVPSLGVDNLLIVNGRVSEQQVYNILKTWFDNLEDVQQAHPEARKLKLDTAAKGSPIPFHPGAIRFYQERGVWQP
ncbi:MAG: TAXI family TRAP transporter solute-binding subunit [Chloroflexota bacterium]|nr:TAXI family TRAP transporter solute-binding subunit [Chloroflexota bacterium]